MTGAILRSIIGYFKDSSDISILRYNRYHVYSAAWIGLFSHPIFWFIWTYLDPQVESIYLRTIGTLMSLVIVILLHSDNKKLLRALPVCWLIMIFYNLPFFFTMNLIANQFSSLWLMAEIVMIFVTVIFIPNILYSTLFIVSGLYLSTIFSQEILGLEFIYSLKEFLSHSPIYVLALFSANIFNYATIAGNRSSERAKIFKSLSGSIAHELRNPLNSISFIGSNIKESANSLKEDNFQEKAREISTLSTDISRSIMEANNIINIILDDISEKEIKKSNFEYINIHNFLSNSINNFANGNKDGDNNILLNIESDHKYSVVKALPERLSFVLYNLLKNAKHYSSSAKNHKITVGAEDIIHDNKNYTSIYVYDNGPGINPDNMTRLFEDFFTSGKKEGTGLGLAFCKRNMQIFGGDIICESEYGEWTKFSLLFPEIKKEKCTQRGNKKILIIDDEKINLLTAKARIDKNLQGASCTIESDPAKALSLISKKNHGFDLILSDYEMPKLNGHTLSEKIRKYDRKIPIIIYSSRLHRDFLGELNFKDAPFNQYLRKDVKNPILYRSITKWLNLKDPMGYLGKQNEYSKFLKDKLVLIADDDSLNRKVIKKKIESRGAKVTEVTSGKEMISAYVKNMDDKTPFDAIISDINMPDLNGDEATKEIRRIELVRKVYHSQRVPIIAITGNGSGSDIKRYLDCKMTDYYIKGDNPELIIKLIANYLNRF